MKKILILTCLLASLLMGGVNAQQPSISFTGSSTVEVGASNTYQVHFDNGGDDDLIVYSYLWHTDTNPIEKRGESGIKGRIYRGWENFYYEPIRNETPYEMDYLTIVWGDYGVCSDNIHVKVKYYNPKDGKITPLDLIIPINIKCVLPPKIEGVNPVNLCCADTIEYCDNSGGKQDDWVWKITGDGADSVVYGDGDTSGQGKKCIKVAVYPSGDFRISALARRKYWKTQTYTRKDSILVERNQPSTSAITSFAGYDGSLFACRGVVTTLCVEPVCGMSSVNWNLGGAFDIVGGAGTECIQVVPRSNYPAGDGGGGAPIPDGTVINVTAQVIMNGGCSTNVSSQNISILPLTPAIPPKPDGYIAVNLIYEPCDGSGGDFELEYVPTTPYVNGFTYMLIDGTKINENEIHYRPGIIQVTVCNINPCSQLYMCEVFDVELDEPCNALGDPYPGWWRQANNGDSEDIEFSQATFKSDKTGTALDVEIKQVLQAQAIVVFPNPASDVLNIRTSELVNAKIVLYDMQGKILLRSELEKSNNLQLAIPSQLSNGIYFLSIQGENKTTVKKITIQR